MPKGASPGRPLFGAWLRGAGEPLPGGGDPAAGDPPVSGPSEPRQEAEEATRESQDTIKESLKTAEIELRLGKQLAAGKPLAAILSELGHAAEGVHTCAEVLKKAREVGVEMPITQEVHRVMFEGLSPRQAVEDLLSREPKAEYRSA